MTATDRATSADGESDPSPPEEDEANSGYDESDAEAWLQQQALSALAGQPITNGAAPANPLAAELKQALLHGADILNVPPPEPLIDGWLNLDSLACLYGRPKGGKSFIALDMALCVASGCWWHGHKIANGPVLYVIAEGVRGVGPRVAAWAEHNKVPVPDDLIWLPRPVQLLAAHWSQALAETAAAYSPRFVIIDTLNRSMAGGDENASKDMGTIIAACDLIKRTTGACVLLVHHSGKDATAGARGHSSLLGAVDTELELKNGGDGILRLSNSAQKDAVEALPLRFTLAAALDSVAISPYRGRTEDDTTLSANGRAALEALTSIEVEGGIATGVWKASVDMPDRTFYDQRKRLLVLGLVRNVGSEGRPRYSAVGSQLETPETEG